MSVSFPPSSFFPLAGGAGAGGRGVGVGVGVGVGPLHADLQSIDARFRRCMSDKQRSATMDEHLRTDVSVLYGEKKAGKSRLLLQLAYRIAAEAAHPPPSNGSVDALSSVTAAPSAAVRGDPFQPVLLLLPRRRNLESMQSAGASHQAQSRSALLGLFGPAMQADVLNNIKIKWYADGGHLLKLICNLHLQSSSSPSNASGVPPRFVGVLYDHTLSSEAGMMAVVMARLAEAVATINRVEQVQFAPCQALFVMSHVPSVARLKTLLPQYARCVFEVTHVPNSPSDWLLHTRPMMSPSTLQLPALNQLLQPMSELQHAAPLHQSFAPIPLALTRLPGMPVIRYTIQPDAIECNAIYV